jgi:two-component system, NarL family, sensor histidine kinase DesK
VSLRPRLMFGGRDASEAPFGRTRFMALGIWLVFILVPVADAITNKGSEPEHLLAIGAAVAFTATYIWFVLTVMSDYDDWRPFAMAAALLVLAGILTVADRASWGFLFTYVAACIGLAVPSSVGIPAVVACGALAAICSLLGGSSGGSAVGWASSSIGVGLLLVLVRDMRVRNEELREARAELARAAVTAERERFARDLHDLLGHTLSVIAIKAELAGRLLPDHVDRAAAEVADVEQVARQALGEVRQAVSGYRQPTLDGELEGARVALSAAGIDAEFDRSPVTLDPEVEAVLAWAVREGATNVIRHSRASHCQVKVSAGIANAAVEVIDDGVGEASARLTADGRSANGNAGHGLEGLAERAERLRGRIEAGRRPEGHGFRLAVSVPTLGSGAGSAA